MSMNVLLVSDVAHTGFGRVGRELATRMLAAGHSVRILGINWRGREGEIAALLERDAPTELVKRRLDEIDADPLTELTHPAFLPGDGLGNALTQPAAEGQLWHGWVADRIIVVADPRAFLNRIARDSGVMGRIPTLNYVPIEGTNLPPFWREMWSLVEPVAMSEFGRRQLEELLLRPIRNVPHGVSEAFFRISPERPGLYDGRPIHTKEEAKEAFGWGGRTILLRTDRFAPRKDYGALLRSVAPLLMERPELLLVIHCSPVDEGGYMFEFLSRVPGAYHVNGKWTHPQIRFTRAHDTFRGLSDADLNVLYNAADIYVSPTQSEGFGLTLAEAGACGVPVVTTDYAAGPEAIGPGALLARIRTTFTNIYACEWALVDEDDFTAKVATLLDDPTLRHDMGRAGAAYVSRFTWEACASAFLDILEAT